MQAGEKWNRRGRKEGKSLRDNLGKYVLAHRLQLNLSQDALAKKAGVNQSFIVRIEKGKGTIDSIPYSSLASALQVSEQEIKWAVVELDHLGQIGNADLLQLVKAIAESGLKSLTLDGLLALLKVEVGLRNCKLTITKEMVPSLLSQVHA